VNINNLIIAFKKTNGLKYKPTPVSLNQLVSLTYSIPTGIIILDNTFRKAALIDGVKKIPSASPNIRIMDGFYDCVFFMASIVMTSE